MSSGPVGEAVARVEAQLNAFWSMPGGPDKAAPRVRASTMNYIVVGALSDAAALTAAIEDVAEARAGRMFIVTADGRLPPWDLASDVSAVCRKEGGHVVCYDRIELTFGVMATERAGSVISSLSLGEVPTVLEVAAGAPSALVDPLLSICDRLIVDSSHTSVARIAEFSQKTRAPIADRAFVRTFSWREIVARFFDDAIEATRAIRRLEIAHTPDGKNGTSALMYGWLASRLGWSLDAAGGVRGADGSEIEVVLRESDAREGLHRGDITGVRIRASLHGEPLELSCERTAHDLRTACWSRTGAKSDTHDLPLGHHNETWVLFKAIDSTEGDRLYREAVRQAADWSAPR